MVQTNFRAIDFKKDDKMKAVSSTRDSLRSRRLAAPEPTSKPVPQEIDENAVPAGTVPEVLTWVGEDKDRAQQALEVENADEKPRKGLVKSLRELIETDDEPDEPAAQDEPDEDESKAADED